jgi:hypothetical protein
MGYLIQVCHRNRGYDRLRMEKDSGQKKIVQKFLGKSFGG